MNEIETLTRVARGPILSAVTSPRFPGLYDFDQIAE